MENKTNKKLNIIENRKKYFAASLIAMIIGFGIMFYNVSQGNGAFNLDVEFAGGTSIVIDMGQDFDNVELSQVITESTGQDNPQVQRVNDGNTVSIKLKEMNEEARADLKETLDAKYGLTDDSYMSETQVSATISEEMTNKAVLASTLAALAMLIYVTIRFKDFKIGASAIIALIHDFILVVLVYAVLRIPVNYSFIAVVLTVLGYSVNSTIVIFDRIRENKNIMSSSSLDNLVDTSVSQTLTRSIYTSLTTLLPITCLYILGVASIKEFSLPIILGVLFGTYSSIFLSGSIWYTFCTKKKDDKSEKKTEKKTKKQTEKQK